MPQAGGLAAPTFQPFPSGSTTSANLRQCATAPNLAGMTSVNRYANLDLDGYSPMVMGSPPHAGMLAMKFYPLPSKYGNLSAASLSQMNLSTSLPKNHVDFGRKPSFSVGPQDEQDQSRSSSRADVPAFHLQTCDSTEGTPRGTPMGSPQFIRKRVATVPVDTLERKPGGGFLGWLTRPSQSAIIPETEFFHQKEDMSSVQAMTSRPKPLKPRAKMPTLADINVFTPSEY